MLVMLNSVMLTVSNCVLVCEVFLGAEQYHMDEDSLIFPDRYFFLSEYHTDSTFYKEMLPSWFLSNLGFNQLLEKIKPKLSPFGKSGWVSEVTLDGVTSSGQGSTAKEAFIASLIKHKVVDKIRNSRLNK